jgi:hypothetical protein
MYALENNEACCIDTTNIEIAQEQRTGVGACSQESTITSIKIGFA